MAKAQISLNTASQNVNDLRVYAPASGVLKNFNIKQASARKRKQNCGYRRRSKIIALVPFNEAQKSQIRVGDNANVSGKRNICPPFPVRLQRYMTQKPTVSAEAHFNIEITVVKAAVLPKATGKRNGNKRQRHYFTSPVSGTLKGGRHSIGCK